MIASSTFATAALVFFVAAVAPIGGVTAAADFALTEYILQLSDISAKLSALAYDNATAFSDGQGNFSHPDYDEIKFYTLEPDQALLARTIGRCFVSFRGTIVTVDDWLQNVDVGDVNIYQDNDRTKEACETRQGFSDFLRTDVVVNARDDLLACAARCADPADCVIITGHSQGGASAAVLSILTYSLQPYVITFGMPPAVDKNCDSIPSEKFYRYVNMRKVLSNDVGFDLVPYSPTLVSHSVHYGHYIIVGPDPGGVKYLGIDREDEFTPDIFDRADALAHFMAGYAQRIASLYNTSKTRNITTSGFRNGVICETSYDELCFSGSCQEFACAPKVNETCIPNSCEVSADCESGTCIYDSCAVGQKMVENGCPCFKDSDCVSGECDQAIINVNWVCVEKGGGSYIGVSGAPPPVKLRQYCMVAAAAATAGLVAALFL